MASKYEREIYEGMNTTLELRERTENPLRRAILENYSCHVHLEGAAMFEKITARDMINDDPAEYTTPARVREIHLECLAEHEQRWVRITIYKQ